MREQLIQYVKLLFAGTPDSEDMQQEILQNTLDRYDDLIDQGKSPEAAYRLAIAGIGDVNELMGSGSPAPIEPVDSTKVICKKNLRAIAIALYIACVIPVVALGNIGNGVIGVCIMLFMVAIATALMVISSVGQSTSQKKADEAEPTHPVYKAYNALSGAVTLAIYLLVSFWSGAWHITWLIFLISAAIDGIVRAIFDLKEAK